MNRQHFTLRTIVLLFLALIGATAGYAADTAKTGGGTETTAALTRPALSFPEKSSAITATFVVGRPEITIKEILSTQLGGPDITNLVLTPIENLLHKSGRFTVNKKNGVFAISVDVSDFSISQSNNKKSTSGGKFLDNVKKFGGSRFNVAGTESVNADWSKDESQMDLRCSVTVQLHNEAGDLVAGETGSIRKTDSTKNIKADIAGLNYASETTKVEDAKALKFETRVIELAAYEAIKNMLPALDATLVKGVPTAPTIVATAKTAVENPSTERPLANSSPSATKGAFCPECGEKAVATAKFCTSCGTKLKP